MPKVVRCWVCKDGVCVDGGTCESCCAFLREHGRCRWGGGCDRTSGEGYWGSFCAAHAAEMAAVSARIDGRRKTNTIPGTQSGDRLGRRPVAERAVELARYVHERGGRVTPWRRPATVSA